MLENRQIDCFNHGFVRLIDWMGDDKRIVDAARVSYQGGTTKVSSDKNLIRYLLRKLHTTPFEKIRFELHVKLPIPMARQWMRHRTGSFNEISARYSVLPNEMYVAEEYRKQNQSNKQGSSDEIVQYIQRMNSQTGAFIQLHPAEIVEEVHQFCYSRYEELLDGGVAREMARGVLPFDVYTEFYWTVDLWNLMHFLRLRLDSHAQYEIQVYAQAIFDLISEHCDLDFALEAFTDYILDRPNITKFELDALMQYIDENCPAGVHDTVKTMLEGNSKVSKRELKESTLLERLAMLDEGESYHEVV